MIFVLDADASIEFAVINKPVLETHEHGNFDEFMIMLQGSLRNEVDNVVTTMEAGNICFLPVNSSHQLSLASHDLLFINLAVRHDFYIRYADCLRLNPVMDFCTFDKIPQVVLSYIVNAKQLYMESSHPDMQHAIAASIISMLTPYYYRPTAKKQDWFDILLRQMEAHENFQAGITRMQELSYCDKAYLSRVCKKRTGMTPSEYIEKLRINYACNLLRNSKYPVNAISTECGYNSLSCFYRSFEKLNGISPKLYRRRFDKLTIDKSFENV